MKQIRPNLWQTATEHPFPGLNTHAYLLTRDNGNVLFYNTGHEHEISTMDALGGVNWQLLSHEDELGDSLNTIAERFGSQLGGHRAELKPFSRYRRPDRLFDKREWMFEDIEIIHTPGHSPGSVCFWVDSAHGRYLLTGDTIYYNSTDNWKAGFIPGHSSPDDVAPLTQSLELLAGLEPDFVFSSAFGDEPGFQPISEKAWPEIVSKAIDALHAIDHEQVAENTSR